MNSNNRGIPLFFPFILGFNSVNAPQESQDEATRSESRDQVILINPLTQNIIVLESSNGSLELEPLFGDLFSRKSGQRPALKASIDAMPSVEIVNIDEQYAVCLEEWEAGGMAKAMPCKHIFHGNCIEKWLKIGRFYPICRYEMPVDEDSSRKNGQENNCDRRRGIWVSFYFDGAWRNPGNQNSSNDSHENSDSSPNHQETEA